MKLSKNISLLFLTTLSLSATTIEVTPYQESVTAFALPEKQLTLNANIHYLDKNIDLFHAISSPTKTSFGNLGSQTALDLTLGYGLHKHISLYYTLQTTQMDYDKSDLTNIHNKIFARINFYDVPSYVFDDFSLDIGLIRNSSNDIHIKQTPYIQAINENTDGDTTIHPQVNLSDLSDNSLFFRLLWGNRYDSALFNFYTGFKYSDINGQIKLQPQHKDFQNYDHYVTMKDFSRDEKELFAGFNFTIESENFIYNTNYQYLRIYGRPSSLKGKKDNSIFDLSIAYKAQKDLLFYIGGRLMLHSYNGLIPYLHNSYSDNSLKHRYGYATVGIVYNFSTTNNLLGHLEE